MLSRRTFIGTLASLAAAPAVSWAQPSSQDFPSKSVTIIVAFAPGQGGDILARTLGNALFGIWDRSVIVDNRPGAGGTLGTRLAAKAAPDGYTLLLGSSGPMAIAPHLYRDAGYDPRKDFTPIMNVAGAAQILVVGAKSRFGSVQDIVRAAKAAPGKLTYASAGSGSTQHLAMEHLKQKAGIDLQHVPYKGSGPAYPDVITGAVDMMFDSLPGITPFLGSGQVRVLAVSTATRIPSLPDVPTMIDAGIPGFDLLGWLGIVAPAGVSPAIRTKLYQDLKKALENDAVRKTLANLGMSVIGNTPEEFGKFIESEYSRWGDLVKASGARVE